RPMVARENICEAGIDHEMLRLDQAIADVPEELARIIEIDRRRERRTIAELPPVIEREIGGPVGGADILVAGDVADDGDVPAVGEGGILDEDLRVGEAGELGVEIGDAEAQVEVRDRLRRELDIDAL